MLFDFLVLAWRAKQMNGKSTLKTNRSHSNSGIESTVQYLLCFYFSPDLLWLLRSVQSYHQCDFVVSPLVDSLVNCSVFASNPLPCGRVSIAAIVFSHRSLNLRTRRGMENCKFVGLNFLFCIGHKIKQHQNEWLNQETSLVEQRKGRSEL